MSFPKIDACVLCEGARPEANNKTILLGFFGVAPHAHILIRDFQQAVTLCFVFSGGGGPAGKFNLKLRLTDPLGVTVSNPTASPEINEGELGDRDATNIFLGFHGLVSGPGRYRVTFIVNGEEHYSNTFTLAAYPKP
jgi:hypothetical protein